MDLEELSKTQIVLLTLLVSFVTSIATGIVTVSLMGAAPPIVAQTVNRVIQQTVEQAAAPATQSASAATTQVKTVVVKESDLISQAIQTADPSIVRLYSSDSESPIFYGLGVITNASGTIATDSGAIGENADAVAVIGGGSRVRAFVFARDAGTGLAYLHPATSTTDGKPLSWMPITRAADHEVLGETVIAIAGKTADRIAKGIITALDSGSIIETDVASDSIMPGSPLLASDGSVIGVSTAVSRTSAASGFLPVSALMKTSGDKAGK